MHHSLAAVLAHVGHNAPSLHKVQFLGEFCRHRKDMRHNRAVFFCNVRCRLDVLLRDQQNMYRRLGIQVVERQDAVVLIGFFARDLAAAILQKTQSNDFSSFRRLLIQKDVLCDF